MVGLTRCYKTAVFLNIFTTNEWRFCDAATEAISRHVKEAATPSTSWHQPCRVNIHLINKYLPLSNT